MLMLRWCRMLLKKDRRITVPSEHVLCSMVRDLITLTLESLWQETFLSAKWWTSWVMQRTAVGLTRRTLRTGIQKNMKCNVHSCEPPV